MSYETDYNYHSKIVEFDDEQYLVQGDVRDPVTMFRPVDQVLECEENNVHKMLSKDNE